MWRRGERTQNKQKARQLVLSFEKVPESFNSPGMSGHRRLSEAGLPTAWETPKHFSDAGLLREGEGRCAWPSAQD